VLRLIRNWRRVASIAVAGSPVAHAVPCLVTFAPECRGILGLCSGFAALCVKLIVSSSPWRHVVAVCGLSYPRRNAVVGLTFHHLFESGFH
jgi:hypothetical protein